MCPQQQQLLGRQVGRDFGSEDAGRLGAKGMKTGSRSVKANPGQKKRERFPYEILREWFQTQFS